MAKKKEEAKVEFERTYNIPLRKGFQKVPDYKRAKKAISVLKEFLKRHMKSDKIKIGKYLNKEIWKHGIKNPPHHVKVTATKDSEEIVKAELTGAPVVKEKKEKKEKQKEKGKAEEKVKEKSEQKGEKINEKTEEEKISKETEETK